MEGRSLSGSCQNGDGEREGDCQKDLLSVIIRMKFIFLDIDGPLNTGRNDYLDPCRYGHHFDDMAVWNLRRIIDETGANTEPLLS